VNNVFKRDPKEMIISAQVHLLFLRARLKNRDYQEWENLTEAVVVLDKCLRLVKEEK